MSKKTDLDISMAQKRTVFLHNVPFENQIGPMCGIAALNCLKAYLFQMTNNFSLNHITGESICQKVLDDNVRAR